MAFAICSQRQELPTPLTPSMPLRLPALQEQIPDLPMTPPDPDEDATTSARPDSSAIKLALHVISTERAALSNLECLYQNELGARANLARAISHISKCCGGGGKLIISGVGKSGRIGEKLVSTFISLGIHSTFLHPTEALHGDLGVIKPNDIVLMITFSGRTPELLLLLQHLPSSITLIVMTSHLVSSTCPLLATRDSSILLPAPIHENEQVSFGVSAPTTSTTVALALGDGLALAVAETLYTIPGRRPADVFQSHHPGGAIGAAIVEARVPRMGDIATTVELVPIACAEDGSTLRSLDVLRTAVRSPGGWVRVSDYHMIAPRRVQKLRDMSEPVCEYVDKSIVIEKTDWISVLSDCSIEEARQWILMMRSEARGRTFLKRGTILGIVDRNNEVSGVVEIEDIVGDDWDSF